MEARKGFAESGETVSRPLVPVVKASNLPVPVMSAPGDFMGAIAAGHSAPVVGAAVVELIDTLTDIEACRRWQAEMDAVTAYANTLRRPKVSEEVEREAKRIRAWSTRKIGQLLQAVPKASGGDRSKSTPDRTFARGRADAAKQAQLSRDQRFRATRLANIPETEFREAVERDKPATVKDLASGKAAKPSRKTFQNGATVVVDVPKLTRLLNLILAEALKVDINASYSSMSDGEKDDALDKLSRVEAWVGRAGLMIRGG